MTIYFISNGGKAIKVGYTGLKPTKRVATLMSASPDRLTPLGFIVGSRHHEKIIHKALAKHRLNGEWFSDCPPVRRFIGRLLIDGIDALNVPEPDVRELDEFTLQARDFARILIKYSGAMFPGPLSERIAAIETQYCIPRWTLWALHYRPPENLMAGAYFALLEGGEKFLTDVVVNAERDLNAIKGVRSWHSTQATDLAETERQLHELQHEVATRTANGFMANATGAKGLPPDDETKTEEY